MDFSIWPLWLYALLALAAIGFGALQCLLLKRAVFHDPPQKSWFALKFALWALALVALALWAVPLLLVFTVISTLALLIGAFVLYRREAR